MSLMADNDRQWFADLVSDFKREILNYIEKGFTDQEKLFDAKLDPMGKSQDRLRDDIDDLYNKNRDTITDISELRTDINNHIKDHDKNDSKVLPKAALIISSLAVVTTIILAIIFGG